MMTGMKRALIGFVIAGLLLIAMAWWVTSRFSPKVESVANTALASLREQNELSAFAARFVTVVTSKQTNTIGLTAEKTLIVPADVTYSVDLSKLEQRDVRWNAASKTLSVTLPRPAAKSIAFKMDAVREYSSGTLLMAFTDVEAALDSANQKRAYKDIQDQAMAEPMMRLARDATARAVERSFAMPLKATGVSAQVKVEFGE
jgi:DNA-binding transcriptional regulator of glucitol operon